MDNLRDPEATPEQKRLASVAITEAQTAQMRAVKALTWRDQSAFSSDEEICGGGGIGRHQQWQVYSAVDYQILIWTNIGIKIVELQPMTLHTNYTLRGANPRPLLNSRFLLLQVA